MRSRCGPLLGIRKVVREELGGKEKAERNLSRKIKRKQSLPSRRATKR